MVWGCGSETGRSHFFVANLNWNEPDKVKIYTLARIVERPLVTFTRRHGPADKVTR